MSTKTTTTYHVTADTITDEQIRELRESVMNDSQSDETDRVEVCVLEYRATAPDPTYAGPHRARCAEILNARKDQP